MGKAPESCLYCDGTDPNCGFCEMGKPLDTQEDWDRTWGRVLGIVAEAPNVPDYLWPDRRHGWIDAWNGWYDTLDEALQDAPAGVGRPWVLRRGEDNISSDEMERRCSAAAVGLRDLYERFFTGDAVDENGVSHFGAADQCAALYELLNSLGMPVK